MTERDAGRRSPPARLPAAELSAPLETDGGTDGGTCWGTSAPKQTQGARLERGGQTGSTARLGADGRGFVVDMERLQTGSAGMWNNPSLCFPGFYERLSRRPLNNTNHPAHGPALIRSPAGVIVVNAPAVWLIRTKSLRFHVYTDKTVKTPRAWLEFCFVFLFLKSCICRLVWILCPNNVFYLMYVVYQLQLCVYFCIFFLDLYSVLGLL